jgi:hypothetical protein
MDPFIQYLLGQGGQASRAAPPEVPDEIVTNGRRYNTNNRREGLVRNGTFSLGRTGGNILGILGDALLAQGGRDPIYQPRLQRAREADALIDLTDDPHRAISQMTQVNPDKAAVMFDRQQVLDSNNALRQSQINTAENEHRDSTNQRALAYIGAATPQTLPRILDIARKIYADAGIEPPFDIDSITSVDDAVQIATGAIEVEDQRKLAEDQRYHDAVIAQDRIEERGRTQRTQIQQSSQDKRTEVQELGRDRRTAVQEAGRDRRNDGPIARPNITIRKDKNGRVIVR